MFSTIKQGNSNLLIMIANQLVKNIQQQKKQEKKINIQQKCIKLLQNFFSHEFKRKHFVYAIEKRIHYISFFSFIQN